MKSLKRMGHMPYLYTTWCVAHRGSREPYILKLVATVLLSLSIFISPEPAWLVIRHGWPSIMEDILRYP